MSRANPRFRRTNPPLPAAPSNVWEIVVQGTIESQMTINTFYYWDNGAALIPGSEVATGAAWFSSVWPTYRAMLSSDWTGVSITTRSMTSPSRAPYVSTAIGGLAGSAPAGHEPTYVSAIIERVTGFRGQCGRGRLGIPAVPTAWVTGSTLTNSVAYNNMAAGLTTNFTVGAITYTNMLWSRGSRTARTVGAAQILNAITNLRLGTIRRRRLGRGR